MNSIERCLNVAFNPRNLESVQSRIRIRLTDPAPGESYPQVRAYHMNDTRIPVRYVD
ncbi:hypothetical protein [Photobacterium halotolerans]|uniref:hypothetical protein n=1 Tax=Photobacterium halotolerans TaxID=265726 RepID=UPI0013724BC5|nr:hypothetical protein [Photobacterium halotolerans]NAW88548.1 hypothetical protein [Photobacterium halotolerans]